VPRPRGSDDGALALSGVVNTELQFEFEEKDKKAKKPAKIRGLKQKNKI
jgi:hypothetical protein